MEKVDRFLYVIDGTAENDVNRFLSADRTLDEYKRYVVKYDDISSDIPNAISPTETVGIFTIDFTGIVDVLRGQAHRFRDAIIAKMKSAYVDIGKR